MSTHGSREMTSEVTQGRPEGGFLGFLRVLALVAVVAGAGGSLVLMLRAGRQPVLVVLFAIWVLSPFVALVWASMVSQRWSVLTRATLYGVMLILAAVSLMLYGNVAFKFPGANAARFLVVPLGSWLLMTIAVGLAALISRKLSRRGVAAKDSAA